MNNICVGTIGFSYKDWQCVFYPSEMNPRNYLAYYSRIISCVEIDTTFYGLPKSDTLIRWKSVTPENFTFCLKAPREITHKNGLVDVRNTMTDFLKAVSLLKEKLGIILLQFPPSFKVNRIEQLEKFLKSLPSAFNYAIEVRDISWYSIVQTTKEPELASLLGKYNICWVATEFPGLPSIIHRTADFIYIRWIGENGSFVRHDHERLDRSKQLVRWIERIRSSSSQSKRVFGFFNNDYAGFAAGTANRFKKIAGLSVNSFRQPQQGKLF
jgi:uncharacterized protein YecE (DUF72 family)